MPLPSQSGQALYFNRFSVSAAFDRRRLFVFVDHPEFLEVVSLRSCFAEVQTQGIYASFHRRDVVDARVGDSPEGRSWLVELAPAPARVIA